MMTEIYWKAFLGALLLTTILKLAGNVDWSILGMFLGSFVGILIFIILLLFFGEFLEDRKKKKEDD